MTDQKVIEQLLDNEREWRRSLFSKVEEIDKKMADLRVTVALISGGISVSTSLLVALIQYMISTR